MIKFKNLNTFYIFFYFKKFLLMKKKNLSSLNREYM